MFNTIENYPQSHMESNINNKQHFVYQEKVEEEGECLEYKHYQTYPFNPVQRNTIKKAICGMLNHKGGSLFIGITDDQVVEGINLSTKQKDEFVNGMFHGLIKDFEPSLTSPKKLYEIKFIPIQDQGKTIENKFVIKIMIKQGDPSELYSTRKDEGDCYKRVDARVLKLSFREIKDEIHERKKNSQQEMSFNYLKPLINPEIMSLLPTINTQPQNQIPKSAKTLEEIETFSMMKNMNCV